MRTDRLNKYRRALKRLKSYQQRRHKTPEIDREALGDLIESFKVYFGARESLVNLVDDLERFIPPEPDDFIDETDLESIFVNGEKNKETFSTTFGVSPATIALVTLNEFFSDNSRFAIQNPMELPESKLLEYPLKPEKIKRVTFDIGSKHHTVAAKRNIWAKDKKKGFKFVLDYSLDGNGVPINLTGSDERSSDLEEFVQEIKSAVLKSPHLRGRVLEIDEGGDFKISDIEEQPEPIVDEGLKGELEKNVINLFDRQKEFQRYGLPLKRSIILSGPPGCGKTMIERWLSSRVQGRVTTVWVTAKAIGRTTDVSSVFDIARKLSPSLVIMEDLDLISGTRQHYLAAGQNALGEMLNQLDGLSSNDSIVVVGSTNAVSSLDEALKDRPGRFDRVYEVGKPGRELAKRIAQEYLVQHGMTRSAVEELSLTSIMTGQFTGAQVVEVVKGAIFEAIHRKCEVNDLCVKASCNGLLEQQKYTKKA